MEAQVLQLRLVADCCLSLRSDILVRGVLVLGDGALDFPGQHLTQQALGEHTGIPDIGDAVAVLGRH